MEKGNKIALVTGGSRGLGKDMALRLAEKGIDVILTYNSQVQDAQGVVAQIQQGGQKAATLQLNTGDIKSFGSFTTQLQDVLHNTFDATHFDYLVNNAGIGGYASIATVRQAMFASFLTII